MEVLVVAIDKDNDLGRKAGVECPVIGRAAVLDAAVKLGLADPEDSDVNTLFAAVKEAEKRGCEVAVICGSGKFDNGDEIARQIEIVLEKTGAKEVVLVGDGAEDESVVPIILSRVPIRGVVRVTVKQLEGVETTFYIVKKYFKEFAKDPSFAKFVFGVPGALLFLFGLGVLVSPVFPSVLSIMKSSVVGLLLLGLGVLMLKRVLPDVHSTTVFRWVVYIADLFIVVAGLISISHYNSPEAMLRVGARVVSIIVAVSGFGMAVIEWFFGNGAWKKYAFMGSLSVIMYGTIMASISEFLGGDVFDWLYTIVAGAIFVGLTYVAIEKLEKRKKGG